MRSARCIADETPSGVGTRSASVASTCCTRLGAESGASLAPPPRALFGRVALLRSAASGVTATSPCTAEGCDVGRVKTTAAATAAAAGSATTSARRHVKRRVRRDSSAAATRRTRSRTSIGAAVRAARSSATRSRCDIESLLEFLERAVQARCAIGGGDPEDARGGRRVQVEHDAQCDDLALAGGEHAERGLEVGCEALGEALLEALRDGGQLLAPGAAALAAEVVERHRARDLAEPRAGRPAPRVEAVPEPQRALERLARQVVRSRPVAGEPGQVPVHVVEVRLGCLGEGHLHVVRRRPAFRHTAMGGRSGLPAARALAGPTGVQLAQLSDLVRVRAGLVLAGNLEIGAQMLERGMSEEGTQALAHRAFEDVRVAVAVRPALRRAVVDVQRPDPVAAHAAVDLRDELVDAAGLGDLVARGMEVAGVETHTEPRVAVEAVEQHLELLERAPDRGSRAGRVLHAEPRVSLATVEDLRERGACTDEPRVESGAKMRADMKDDRVRADRTRGVDGRSHRGDRTLVDAVVRGGEVDEVQRVAGDAADAGAP